MKRALPELPPGRVVKPATARPDEGVVSWNMNTTCNYRCTYCTQRFLDDRGRWADDVPRFLAGFARLTGPWEVKLSGGEPFQHPRFTDVVRGLALQGKRVSVVTNFSASVEKLAAFVAAAGDQLRSLSCSLHLEYAEPAEYLEKAVRVKATLPAGASLHVTCVATHANLPLLSALQRTFEARGVPFKVQPEKQAREVIAYDDDEKHELVQLGGHNGTGLLAADFGGQPCWAGARYFIVDDRGECFRCYPARRYRVERMGNLLDGTFTLHDAPQPCLYRYCGCTVPIARAMMPLDGVVDRAIEEA
jgi:organic radical activating enzyme